MHVCLLVTVCCLLFVFKVWCLVFVVCCLVFAVCCSTYDYLVFVVCSLCVWSVALGGWLWFVVRRFRSIHWLFCVV